MVYQGTNHGQVGSNIHARRGTYVAGGLPAAWSAILFIVLIFACVVAHDFGHIFMARAFGINTPDVTLLPIGGVASM